MTLPEIPQQYILPIDQPDWAELLTEWQPLIPRQSSPWLLTKFGELFFNQPDGKIGLLLTSGFQYHVVAENQNDFRGWLADPDKIANWFLAPLVDRLEAAGRRLQPEHCYSFITPLGLGGALSLENVMTVPIREHFSSWGEVFRQIKDLPDGRRVVLKIK